MEKKLLGEILIEKGLVTIAQLQDALDIQVQSGKRIGDILVELNYISRKDLEKIIYEESIVLSDLKIKPEVLNTIPVDYAKKNKIIPIRKENNVLTVAMADSHNFSVIDDLKFMARCEVEVVLCPAKDVEKAIELQYQTKEGEEERVGIPTDPFKQEVDHLTQEIKQGKEEEAPISRLVSLLIKEAFRRRASDLHLEPVIDAFRIRYRIDGVLHEVLTPPVRLQGPVLSRIKLMAGMDIAEKRLPQDGRIKFTLDHRDIDLRVSSLPGTHGESLVLRILDKGSLLLGLHELGFFDYDEAIFERLLNIPNGIILVTGPTGSGKTTTLYGSLNYINRPDKKLITVEDPVEYQLTGINQVQVKEKINLTFASALRAILRQSPDVIMIGEIRDIETAQITMQAALTGHLVFSTLHTNDSAGAIVRLMDMGVPSYLVSSSLQAVVAQRLVRKICEDCKEQYHPTEVELAAIGIKSEQKPLLYRGAGCKKCSFTGYYGRTGIFEILLIEENIRQMIFEQALSSSLRKAAKEAGMHTLKEDGIRKVMLGITTVNELIRVTQEEMDYE